MNNIGISRIRSLKKEVNHISMDIVNMREYLYVHDGMFLNTLFNNFVKPLLSFGFSKKNHQKNNIVLRTGNKSKKSQYEEIKLLEAKVRDLKSYREKLGKILSNPIVKIFHNCICLAHHITEIPGAIRQKKIIQEVKSFQAEPNYRNIVNFSTVSWFFRYSRQQHLLVELSKLGNRIFYIEHTFYPSDKHGFSIQKIRENVYVVKLNAIRKVFIYHETPNDEVLESIIDSYEFFLRETGLDNVTVKIEHPFWGLFIDKLIPPVVYDCVDDYEGFYLTDKKILDVEKKLIKKSDMVVACTHMLYEKIEKEHPKKLILVRNACEFSHFNKVLTQTLPTPLDIAKIKKPIAGYMGDVGEWLDEKLIEQLAKSQKHLSIVIIGRIQNERIRELSNQYPNIHALGEKKYADLPSYISNFDVCLIPTIVNESSKRFDHIKLYEYLASGKPVVTSDIEEIYRYRNFVYIAKDNNDFVKKVTMAIEAKSNSASLSKRLSIAQENTWEQRAKIFNEEMSKTFRNM